MTPLGVTSGEAETRVGEEASEVVTLQRNAAAFIWRFKRAQSRTGPQFNLSG